MNGLTQSTTAKILALTPVTELEILRIVDAAMTEAAKPHRDESEACKKLVNDTNDRARAEVTAQKDIAANQQNEIIGLRAELAEAKSKVIDAGNRMSEQQVEIERLKAEAEQTHREYDAVKEENERIVADAKQCHARNDELVSERGGLKAENETLKAQLAVARDEVMSLLPKTDDGPQQA